MTSSNQTGNTVLVAVALAGTSALSPAKGELFLLELVGVSLALFVAGAATTGHIGHFVGSRRRSWLLFTNIVQTVLVFSAAIIQFRHPPEGPHSWTLGTLALLAFASGAQVGAGRAMRIPEITTAMATAAWVDFIIDAELLRRSNRSRNRRALFLVMLVVGSVIGAFMRLRIGSGWALMVSAFSKVLATLLIFLSRAESSTKQEGDVEKGLDEVLGLPTNLDPRAT